MKKALIKPVCAMLTIAMLLAGCGKEAATEPEQEETDAETVNDGTSDASVSDEPDAGSSPVTTFELDVNSRAEIMDFLKGEWNLIDGYDGEEFATLSINSQGDCVYHRESDDASMDGRFEISRHPTYDAAKDEVVDDPQFTEFKLSFSDIPDAFSLPEEASVFGYLPDADESYGRFFFGRGEGQDYLYLNWIGNGDSFIFGNVFQNKQRIINEIDEGKAGKAQLKWLFTRPNDQTSDTERLTGKEFYAWAWNGGEDGLTLQAMDVHTYESMEEYVPRRFLAAYFTEQKACGPARYSVSEDADLSLVIHQDLLSQKHPLCMYKVSTDSDGEVISIEEMHMAPYDEYDLETLETKCSYEGLGFEVNGCPYELSYYDAMSNAIMDVQTVGDWVIVEGHVNPHVGEYLMLNVCTGNVEKIISGANLTWVGDDVTTAVYSAFDCVYNYKGHLIGTIDGGEVDEISLNSAGTQILVTDMDGKKYTFQTERTDEAMYRYADYLRHPDAHRWKAFMEQAPGDAIALVMTNPPEDVSNLPGWSVLDELEPESEERLLFASLKPEMHFHLDKGRPDLDAGKFVSLSTVGGGDLGLGECHGFVMTIPETIPSYALYVSDDEDGGEFDVSMITGKDDTCSTFVTASMTAREALNLEGNGPSDIGVPELMDAYADVLNKHKEAQDNKYSDEQVRGWGLPARLQLELHRYDRGPRGISLLFI